MNIFAVTCWCGNKYKVFAYLIYLKNEANFSEKTFYLYRTLFNTLGAFLTKFTFEQNTWRLFHQTLQLICIMKCNALYYVVTMGIILFNLILHVVITYQRPKLWKKTLFLLTITSTAGDPTYNSSVINSELFYILFSPSFQFWCLVCFVFNNVVILNIKYILRCSLILSTPQPTTFRTIKWPSVNIILLFCNWYNYVKFVLSLFFSSVRPSSGKCVL